MTDTTAVPTDPNPLDAFVDPSILEQFDHLTAEVRVLAGVLIEVMVRAKVAFREHAAASDWRLDMAAYDAAVDASRYGQLRDLVALLEAAADPDYRPSTGPDARDRMLKRAALDAGLSGEFGQLLATPR